MQRGINIAGRRAVWALYPIAIGEIWGIGPHRVLCADFREATSYGWLDRLFDSKTPDTSLVDTTPYASPQAFAQIARQAGRGIKSINLDDFAAVVASHIASLQPNGGLVGIRSPIKRREGYRDAFENLRYTFVKEEPDGFVNHPNAAPRMKLVMGRAPELDDDKGGLLAPRGIFNTDGDLLYDPMCGTGSSLLLHAKEMPVYGVEISPLRAALSIHRLAAFTKTTPEPIDH